MSMTPQQHTEQAEILLAEARDALVNLPADPRDQRGDRRLAVANLAATRAIAHALLAQVVPTIEVRALDLWPGARHDDEGRTVDGGRP